MRKEINKIEVTEDIVMKEGSKEATVGFGHGYDSYKFPLTVSFDCEGDFIVRIEGKKATVNRI